MSIFLQSPLTLLFTGGILLSLGDIAMKEWMKLSDGNFSSHTHFYLLGLLAYGIGLTFFAFTLKSENIAIASIILVFFNVLIISFVGHLFFKETFTPLQILGMFVGLIAIAILELK